MAKKKEAGIETDASDFAARINEAYATDGKALLLGAAVKGDAVLADARVQPTCLHSSGTASSTRSAPTRHATPRR
jgi:hypothetical protein